MAASPPLTAPERAERVLADLVPAAKTALGDTLESIVLFGSAAEGRLRPSSDLNVIFVLNRFDAARVEALADPVRVAQAAIRLAPMVMLRDEIPHAAAAFAVKFADIVRRHRVLHGADPFVNLPIARERLVARLTQVLMNLRLRLRAAYLTRHTFDDQLIGVIVHAAGALRSAAATLRELEGQPRLSPKESLAEIVKSLGDSRFVEAAEQMSVARERGVLPPAAPRQVVLALIDLAGAMHERAAKLRSSVS
jgi:predicted nucleotidyltransferase